MLTAAVALAVSLILSPLAIQWWLVVSLGLLGSLITIVCSPELTDRAGRHRATTSHGVVLGYLVLALAGPTSALIVNAVQYAVSQLIEHQRGRATPGFKWWFNQAVTTTSIVTAWLVIAPLQVSPDLATLLMPLVANLVSATLVTVMVSLVSKQSVLAMVRADWSRLVWTNTDSTLITHYAGLTWLHAPWLSVTVPLLLFTRGQLTSLVAQAVDRVAVETELARRDGLTGLFNRRSLDQALDKLVIDHRHAAILLIDLDHFKRINDSVGHLAGDDVLRAVARCIEANVRPGDTVARYGGEELCVVAPGITNVEQGAQLGERLRAAIAQTVIMTTTNTGTSVTVQVTASIGVSFWQQGASTTDVLHATDHAVYEAKKAGRNRVHIDEMTLRVASMALTA